MKKIPILKKTVLILILLFSFSSYSQTISLGIEHEETIIKEISDENELSIINELGNIITRLYKIDAQRELENGKIVTRRTNSKTHGCIEGDFKVESDLPENLSKGFITPNSNYKALIRFANGNLGVQPDITPDGRSISIKLKNVPGKRVIGSKNTGDVDLHLISANIFFCDNPQEMIDLFLFNENKKKWLFKNLLKFKRLSAIFKNVDVIKNKSVIISNPIEIPYFTPVPFKLGDKQQVKYIIKPCSQIEPFEIPENPSDNFLRENMQEYLEQKDVCFDFFIQLKKDYMSIDNARVEWREKDSPYIKVAQLIIPKQFFNNPETDKSCEDETYFPYNTLEENKPLGSMNRARFAIYQKLTTLRMNYNNKETGPIF